MYCCHVEPPRLRADQIDTVAFFSSAPNLLLLFTLEQHFAIPLRQYSKSSSTAVISAFQANHLFINLEELVPLSVDFERDLRTMAGFIEQTKDLLPGGFGEMILTHVRLASLALRSPHAPARRSLSP